MTERNELELLALSRAPFMTAREKILLSDILPALGGLERLNHLDAEQILGRRLRSSPWNSSRWLKDAENDMRLYRLREVKPLWYWDGNYPAALRETARPPYMLFLRGRLPDPEKPMLAMVGTRFPSGNGMEAASRIASEAGMAGIVVVSGLARGIDSASHRGCISAPCPSIAVLGCGVDSIYPASNSELAGRLLKSGGGILSEYPPGVPPGRWTFPERNRIIAGLCRSTLVVEAPKSSGALITAGFALEEGRDVYIARDCLGSARNAGADALAEDGAKAVSGFKDIALDWEQEF